jgi:5-methylcytosine-specific restriction endonuclease McrBC regulatory subunit McrC
MITNHKVSIYEKYNGLVEAYIFENSDLPNEEFNLNDWILLDELIGHIILLKSGKAAISFQLKLRELIGREAEDNITIEHLEKIAEKKIKETAKE